jgi:hypothetical protein
MTLVLSSGRPTTNTAVAVRLHRFKLSSWVPQGARRQDELTDRPSVLKWLGLVTVISGIVNIDSYQRKTSSERNEVCDKYSRVPKGKVLLYDGVSKSFRTESVTKYTLTFGVTRREATQRVIAAELTRLTHKIAIQLHLLSESCTICSARSRRPVQKLLDTSSYAK